MSKNRVKVECGDQVVYVLKPGTKEVAGAKKASNKAFKEALESGCFLRSKLDKIMRDQGLWDDNMQKEVDEINKRILENTRKLKRGKIELDDARKLAIEIRRDRNASLTKLAKTRELEAYSAEGQSDNAGFDYLVSVCTVDEQGKPIFSSVEDYLEKADEDLASKAAAELGRLVYGLDPEWENKLPENEFLLKYKFCNEDLSLVNEDGKLVAVNGRLIDEKGRYRTEDGGYEDVDGNPIDENGNYLDFQPFTKNGEPV